MICEKTTLTTFKDRHPCMELVEKIDAPHAILSNRPIEVYCEDILQDGKNTLFWLFNQGVYVGNPITFPCAVKDEDKKKIAQDMIEELLSASDFSDLDFELSGKVPCEEHRDVYSKCEDCELFK